MPDYNLGTARGKIELDSSGVDKGVGEAQRSIRGLHSGNEAMASSLVRTGAIMGGIGLAAVAGFGIAVNAAANFEKGISAIGAVSGAGEKQLESLRKKALQLGADTKFSASEAAGAMEELVKAGLSVEDVLNGAADATVNLAAAGEIDLKSAATIAANAMNQFHLAAKDLPKVADLIAGAANASAIDVGDFGLALQQAGATANLVGLSFDDLSVAIAAMGNAGIRGSDAGTSLKTFLSNLQPITKKQTTLFKELGLVTKEGANQFFDASGKIRSMSEIAGVLATATKGMTDQQKALTLETIFGSDAIRAAAIITNTGAKGFDKLAESMGKVTAQEVAEKRMDNLAGSIEQFKGSVETALISAGSPFQDMLRGIVDGATKLINAFGALPKSTQKMIIMIILAIGAFIGLAGVIIMSVGFAMKFVTAMKHLDRAFKIVKGVKKVAGAFKALGVVMMANPVFLVIAAIVALGIALFILYKKSETFRKAVDKLWQNLQKGFDIIREAVGNAVEFIKRNWDLLLPIFLGPIGAVILIWRRFGDDIKRIAGAAVSAVVSFFQGLPGRVMVFVSAVVSGILDFISKLPERIGYFLGLVIGTWIRWQAELYSMAIEFGVKLVTGLVKFFMELPGKIWDIVSQIPGIVWTALTTILTNTASFVADMIGKAIDFGARFIAAVVSFFTQLPGKVWGFLSAAIVKMATFVTDMVGKAVSFGARFASSIDDGVKKIPGIISGALGKAIELIKGMITKAFNAVKGFASSMWQGFKKGLFGSPHTKIEYAMWDMVDNVTASIKDLRAQVLSVQKIHGELADTPAVALEVTGSDAELSDLASRIKSFFAETANSIMKFASDMISEAATFGRNFADSVEGGLGRLPEIIKGAMDSAISTIKSMVADWMVQAAQVQKINSNLIQNAGTGVNSAAAQTALSNAALNATVQLRDAAAQATTLASGDHIEFHEVKADAQEIVEDIMWRKRIRSR